MLASMKRTKHLYKIGLDDIPYFLIELCEKAI